MPEVFQEHLARLLDTATVAGIKALGEMVAAGQITPEEKCVLQCQFCGGMGKAHFVMADPKQAVTMNRQLQGDACVESTMNSNIRTAAEGVLKHMMGEETWRVSLADVDACFEELRTAVLAKPSEIPRPEWAQPEHKEDEVKVGV